jgi:tetratricopeptide (TPR) repeat protein
MNTLDTVRQASDQDLSRWTKRLGLLVILVFFAFVAFYAVDRWRPAAPSIIDQQVAALEQGVRDNPNDIVTRGRLADAYVSQHRLEEAVAQYDIIIAAGAELEAAHMGRAAAMLGLERLDEAAADYGAVVEIAAPGEMANVDLTLEAAYYGLGSIALKQGLTSDAIAYLEKALAIKRSDADAEYLLGRALIANGETEKAITILRAAVVFVPVGWSEPYAALAEAYTALGDAAHAAWAEGMASLASGDVTDAETALLALGDGPAALDAAIGLGLLHETRGDNADAVTWYERALAIDPDDNAARLGLNRVGPMATDAAEGPN